MTPTRLSVAMLNNFSGPSLGGAEVQLLALVRDLPARGIDPIVVCEEGSALAREAAGIGGVRVLTADFRPASLVATAWALRRRLAGVRIVQGTGFLTNILARVVGRSVRAAVVNTVQVVPGAARLDGESWPMGLVRAGLDRSTRTRVGRYIAVSAAVADGLVADDVAQQRITIVPNGVDIAALRSSASLPLAAPLRGGRPRIGYVGRLERVKGVEYFIRAAAGILERFPDARFVVAGSGALGDEMKALSVHVGVADRFDFLGYVGAIAPLYAALDVVVIPSLSEASGLTAIESLALGVPVVATRVGGLPEVVIDGETGLLVPPGDAEAIGRAVELLLRDPARATEMAAAGGRRVEASFTLERTVSGYADIYDGLVRDGAGR